MRVRDQHSVTLAAAPLYCLPAVVLRFRYWVCSVVFKDVNRTYPDLSSRLRPHDKASFVRRTPCYAFQHAHLIAYEVYCTGSVLAECCWRDGASANRNCSYILISCKWCLVTITLTCAKPGPFFIGNLSTKRHTAVSQVLIIGG